jgi:small subunit ribosomal protein S1
MSSDQLPDVPLDESYWQSLLNEVEDHYAPDRLAAPHRSPGAAPRSADPDALWRAAQHALDDDAVIQVRSIGSNRGGLLVDWNGLRGFMPASHLCDFVPQPDEESRRDRLAERLGQQIDAKVIEIDRPRGRFVVSERLACPNRNTRDAALADLCEGQARSGVVTNVCNFGAFVDLGGVEGLLHISEISWGRVNHPGDLLKPGQTVRVLVMSVDRANNRIALSIKRLSPDPWSTVDERYTLGQIIEGTVTSVVAFGAFARLEDGLEGLIHISELAEGNFLHPRNVVCEGQTVRVCVVNIDGTHRRLGLSLRRVSENGLVEEPTLSSSGPDPVDSA